MLIPSDEREFGERGGRGGGGFLNQEERDGGEMDEGMEEKWMKGWRRDG